MHQTRHKSQLSHKNLKIKQHRRQKSTKVSPKRQQLVKSHHLTKHHLSTVSIQSIGTSQFSPPLQGQLKIKDLTEKLKEINSSQPEREIWWIIQAKTGIPETILRRAAKFSHPDANESEFDISNLLTPIQLNAVHGALNERIQMRRPLQYVLGDVEFCKLNLRTQEGILIPRPETEQMTAWLINQIKLYNQAVLTASGKTNQTSNFIEPTGETFSAAVSSSNSPSRPLFHGKYPFHTYQHSWFDSVTDPLTISQRLLQDKAQKLTAIQSNVTSTPHTASTTTDEDKTGLQNLQRDLEELRVLDLCSGSGNISLSLGTQFPYGKVVGVDIDPNALQLARFNKRQLKCSNVKFYHCDVFRNSISQSIDPTTPPFLPQKIDIDQFHANMSSSATTHVANKFGFDTIGEEKFDDPTMDPRQNPDFLFTTTKLQFNPQGGTKTPIAAVSALTNVSTEQFLGLYDLPILSSLADIIISNPPYVLPETIASLEPEVKNWENHFALTPFNSIYNSSELGVPYKADPTDLVSRGLKFSDLPPWPTKDEIRQHALPFYERIIKNSTRLLTHNEHYFPAGGIKFPRLVLEIGHESQALYVANMASYIFDVEVYADAYDRPRWVVGYEPPGYH